ncbi:hypothetical protein [Luteimonas sp. SDU101]
MNNRDDHSNDGQNRHDVIELGTASTETHGILVGEETFGGEPPAGISEN